MSTKTTAYGSITIIDVTDIGELSIYPESNSPLSVVYDPNQGTYTPDWTINNVLLRPVVYYAGKQLTSSTSGLTVTWTRKDGTGAEVGLQDGETKNNQNELTINKNVLSNSAHGVMTYLCEAVYNEPDSGATLKAKGQITFTLVKNATLAKQCRISGENVFKYNANRVVYGTGIISLTAVTSNVGIKQWQYQDANKNWVAYPTDHNANNSSETLNVYATDNVFNNDVVTLKVTTDDDSVYDIYTITKLYDGVAGNSTVAGVLDNDDQWIACDSNYNPLDGAFANAKSKITILEGGTDVTDDWNIEIIENGVTGSYDEENYIYTVNGMTQVSASVTFNCTKTGYTPIVKIFSLTKIKAGADGTSPIMYSIEPSTLATNRTIANVYTPSSVTFTAYSQDGNNARTQYAGRFKIYTNDSDTAAYTSQQNESAYTYTFSGNSLTSVRCELFPAGGGGSVLDTQTIVVTSDGKTGAQGPQGNQGVSATNVVLGNQADIIPCDSDGNVKSNMSLEIPFTGYLGTTKAACSVIYSTLPNGMTLQTNQAGTASSGGMLKFNVAKGSNLGGQDSGLITITATCNGTSSVHYYQWSKSIQSIDGENAILLQLFAPNGDIIINGENDVTIQAYLLDGSSDVTDQATYEWSKYENGEYTTINTVTTSELTVAADSVSGYASYRCVATYPTGTDNKYTQYFAVKDRTDPIQASVHCSLGTQIVNGKGYGAVYTKITRNGVEIDALKSERFLTTDPAGSVAGEFYYQLDTANKNVKLMKYSGSKWEEAPASDLPTKKYTYTFRDIDGNITQYKGASNVTGKVIYIDGELINKKIVIDVEVEV